MGQQRKSRETAYDYRRGNPDYTDEIRRVFKECTVSLDDIEDSDEGELSAPYAIQFTRKC